MPDDPDSAIDTELALADAERLLAGLPAPTQPTDHGLLPAALRGRLPRRVWSVHTSCRLPPMARLLMEIFTHDGIGTMVVDEKLESLREASLR